MRRRLRHDRGTGMIGSLAAVLVFLAFLLLSAQLLATLYARSVVNAAGFDAARQVASRDVDHADPDSVARARRRADQRLRALLGPMGDEAELTWASDGTSVSLRVQVRPPQVPVPGLARRGRVEIDRRYTVRLEQLR
jgi:Flp pilus assembly protein TadG